MKEAFDKDTIDYHLEVPNSVTKLTIDTEVEDSTATYEIIGNNTYNSEDDLETAINGLNAGTYKIKYIVKYNNYEENVIRIIEIK